MAYHERHLPHWYPEGRVVFVTFRLHGSLPKTFVAPQGVPSGQAFVAIDRALDRADFGPQWLTDERIAGLVAGALHYGEEKLGLYELLAWVLMSNHVHIVVVPRVPLPRIMKTIKGFTALRANEILGRRGMPFWQQESFDRWVRDGRELERVIRNVEHNPVSAGLVSQPEDWRWSSALTGRRPILPVPEPASP